MLNGIVSYALRNVDAVVVQASEQVERYREAFRHIGYICYVPVILGIKSAKLEEESPDGYVFSGGVSLRDWPTLFEAAEQLSEVRFVVCAAPDDRATRELPIPDNVTVCYDLSSAEFTKLLGQSRFAVLTLSDDQATSASPSWVVLSLAARRS